MLSKFRNFFYLLIVSAALAACSGEDGEPGPQGEQGEQGLQGEQGPQGSPGAPGQSAFEKIGSLEGTVTGTRKDGTAFSETFKYEYTFNTTQAFYTEEGQKYLEAMRFSKAAEFGPRLYMDMKEVSEGVFTPRSTAESVGFFFEKELNNDDLFMIEAMPYFQSTPAFVQELSIAQNNIYNFASYSGHTIAYDEDMFNGTTDSYRFMVYTGNSPLEVHYNRASATGALLGLYDYETNQYITSGSLFNLYNKLRFKYNATLSNYVFYDAATNAGLFTEVPAVPADQLTITNYVRNATTGFITFDFQIKVSGVLSTEMRTNSTEHDITITGKYNSGGKVYKNIVARTGN